MNKYTKEQIENIELSPMELVESWTSGQGNPAANYPDNLKEVKTFLATNAVSPVVLQARGIIHLIGKNFTQSTKDALLKGYAGGPRHVEQYNKTPNAKGKSPLIGHVMTSGEWLESCIDKLPEIPAPDYQGACVLMDTITDSMTKTQIMEILNQARVLTNVKMYTITDCTGEQQDKYYDLLRRETLIAEAIALVSPYLTEVHAISDDSIAGNYSLTSPFGAEFNRLVSEEKWIKTDGKAVVDTTTYSSYVPVTIQVVI